MIGALLINFLLLPNRKMFGLWLSSQHNILLRKRDTDIISENLFLSFSICKLLLAIYIVIYLFILNEKKTISKKNTKALLSLHENSLKADFKCKTLISREAKLRYSFVVEIH